ncbi:MAG: hypothetical protein ACRD50_08180 [Candidatus Acidiferrales bacterium]
MLEQNQVSEPENGTPRWVGLAVVVLAAVSLISLGVGWTASSRSKSLEEQLASQTQTQKQTSDLLSQRLAQAEQTNAQVQGELNVVTDRLKLTQGEADSAKRQARQILAAEDKKLADVNSQLATKANTDDVNKLGTDVNGVKTDLEAEKNSLQMTRGEFGTLIAKNHDQIEELRRLGERDYFEFTIDRKGSRQKVGNITVQLRGTNVKKNLFSVSLIVDDKNFEKKNRSVDEPIYLLTHSTRAPYEFVVNEIGKDHIVGYLSVPKTQAQPQQQGSGN